jgi:hypothetical protein
MAADIGLRLVLSTGLALSMLVFIVFWELGAMDSLGPYWLGTLVYAPILAYLVSFCIALAIQYMSCKKVDAAKQASNATTVPILYYAFVLLLNMLPGLRFPVEGVTGNYDFKTRRAISSGFYAVLMSYLAQEMVNGNAVKCD